MTLKAILGTGAIAGLALGASAALADHHEEAAEGHHDLMAHLSGGESGDADGMGMFHGSFNDDDTQLCYMLHVEDIEAPGAAHIHAGAEGASGPPVVPLEAPSLGAMDEVCVAVDPAVAAQIKADPASYYVNVHNGEFRGGAVRGQLAGGG